MRKILVALVGTAIATGFLGAATPASANCWPVDVDGRCITPCLVVATVYYTATGDHADCPA